MIETIKTIKNQRSITFFIEYTALKVDVRISLDSLKNGVSKINTNIRKYLNVRKTFSTTVLAHKKSVKFLASTAS